MQVLSLPAQNVGTTTAGTLYIDTRDTSQAAQKANHRAGVRTHSTFEIAAMVAKAENTEEDREGTVLWAAEALEERCETTEARAERGASRRHRYKIGRGQ